MKLLPIDVNKIDISFAEKLLGMFHYKFLGLYQRDMLEFLLSNSKVLFLAARQSGKTELVSFVVALYVLFGHKCLVAMQTKTSGFDIFTERINYFLDRLERFFPSSLRRLTDRRDFVVCANGGGFKIVSSDDAFKGSEGWSATLLVIDEAHWAKDSFFGKIKPTQTIAEELGIAKTIIMGVQGFKDSLIHTLLNEDRGFTAGMWDCYEVVKTRPSYQAVIDVSKREMNEVDFAQFYELKAVQAGKRYIFESLPPALQSGHELILPVPYAGIDVGRKRDSTIVSVGKIYADMSVEVVDYLELVGLTFKEQAKLIVEFLRGYGVPEPYVLVELNSIGQALLEALYEFSTGFNGMVITRDTKKYLIDAASSMARQGKLAVKHPTMHKELEKLTFVLKDTGEVDYEHSDYLSSLLMLLGNLYFR